MNPADSSNPHPTKSRSADMVSTFMNGIDPNYLIAIDEFIDSTLGIFSQRFGAIVENLISTADKANFTKIMRQARRATVENFRERLNTMLEEENSQPIMSIVESLPKDELAEMAEALVNLTSFKRRVTPEVETVGGPIDVAVISKGDGLIWIKRKHYFSPELNVRYFNRDANSHRHTLSGGAS